jgi:UDP-N-acetylmuramyl pentapeptide phosphotransferase/UDP-N-acetylglucosamine-1-phosphate transferase
MSPSALAGSAAFAVSFILIGLMLRMRWHWAVDLPNHRSLHSDPTPRSGGIAIMLAIIAAAAIASMAPAEVPWVAVGLAALLSAVSLLDDRNDLPITARLAAHLMASGAYAAWTLGGSAPWWVLVSAALALAAMTNFYNFMDGANGLAGGMAVAGFATLGMASLAGAPGMAAVCFAVAAAAAGFLCFNLSGRIFMGDGGSVPLGFLAAAIGLDGWVRGLWPVWFAPLAFAPFVVDATVTLLRRALRGERFWQAHREHYYQRLVRMGTSHLRLAVVEYALMGLCAAAALIARSGDAMLGGSAFATIVVSFIALGLWIDIRWARRQAAASAHQ